MISLVIDTIMNDYETLGFMINNKKRCRVGASTHQLFVFLFFFAPPWWFLLETELRSSLNKGVKRLLYIYIVITNLEIN